MIKAQQIERDGTKHGAVRKFTAEKWRVMKETYGKKLRWAIISETPEEKQPEEVEYPPIMDLPINRPHPELVNFDNMTKKMIISEYDLPDEDIKLNREDLINKVLNKE